VGRIGETAGGGATPQGDGFNRRALLGAGATLGAGVLLAGCGETASGSAAAGGPPLNAAAAGLPYRQDDPRWGSDPMWDRRLVIKAATELDGRSAAEAEHLIRQYADGNTIANDGCQLTCIAMALRLFDPHADPTWTPATLNDAAHENFYYTLSGLSLTTLYSDIASDMTDGAVQLLAKEEYLSGQKPWPRVSASQSALVRAYRSLAPEDRSGVLVMVKTGTWDDTVASHYVLIDPDGSQSPDDPNARILDPVMPLDKKGPWRLSDSAEVITQDEAIAAAWKRDGITPTQIGGAWAFARWEQAKARPLAGGFVEAWAKELAHGRD